MYPRLLNGSRGFHFNLSLLHPKAHWYLTRFTIVELINVALHHLTFELLEFPV